MQERQMTAILIGLIILAAATLFIPGSVAVPTLLVSIVAWLGVVALGAWMAFDASFWRSTSMLRDWVDRPDLHGTWGATLRSNWTDPTTGKTLQAIEAYMVIKQSFRSIKLRLLTSESTSEVLEASVLSAGDGKFRIAAIYRSNPKQGRDEGGHTGMLILDVPSKRPKKLGGRYSTDRGTEGEVEMHGRSRRLFSSFREAHDAFHRSKAKAGAAGQESVPALPMSRAA